MTTLEEIVTIKEELSVRKARHSFATYIQLIKEDYDMQWFHRHIADKLNAFCAGEIKNLMILLPPQTGKAIEDSTPVFTTKGWKTHGELKRGDFVFSPNGHPVKILAVTGSSLMKCSTVVFTNGEQIIASNEHEWEIYRDSDKRMPVKDGRSKLPRLKQIVETKNLFNGYNRRNPAISISEPLEMPYSDLPIDPYILGSWIGDGTSHSVAITTKDFEVLDRWKDYATKSNLQVVPDKKGFTYMLKSLNRRENIERRKFSSLGVLNNKHIPENYLLSSREQRMSLLWGLMDTDGCVDLRGNCEYCTTKENIARDVLRLCCSLGFRAYLLTGDAKLYGRFISKKYRIQFKPKSTDIVFCIKRKQERLTTKKQKDKKYNFRFIRSVEDAGIQSAQCIQVEGGLYCVGDTFITTHNSELGSRLLPGYIFGHDANKRIGLITYNDTFAKKFNRQIQRYMMTPMYSRIFPGTNLQGSKLVKAEFDNYTRNSNEFEIVNNSGSLIAVGRDGQITGLPIDILIIDDLYKDRGEAISPTVSEKIWTNYLEVFRTRLHNDSQQLLMNTRWDERDVAGRLLESEPGKWEVIKFPAIKTKEKNDYDIRKEGEVLYPAKHSLERMNAIKELNSITFNSLYQQDPKPDTKLLIFNDWQDIDHFPETIEKIFWGIDWGFTNDPTVLVRIGIEGMNLYLDECMYQTGNVMTDGTKAVWTDIIIRMLNENGYMKGQPIYADHVKSEIAALRNKYISIFPAIKGEGSIQAGIEKLKSFNIFITKRSVNGKKEANNYQWTTIGNIITNIPLENGFDHFWDASRMGVYTHTARG